MLFEKTTCVAALVIVVSVLTHGARSLSAPGLSYEDFSLNGDSWSVRNANGSVVVRDRCTVPGDIYGDLMNNDLIGNPFYRYGDEVYRWIAYDNWTYTNTVSLPSHLVNGKKLVLVVEGMQVVSEIFINGFKVGNTTDEFQRYDFDVTEAARANSSHVSVEVRLTSSVGYATERYRQYNLPGKKPVAPAYLVGLPHRNFIRAEQSSFGWDWGPAFAPQGIYKPLYIRCFAPQGSGHSESVKIDHLTPHIFPLPYNQSVVAPLDDGHNVFWIQFYVYYTNVGGLQAGAKVTISAPTLNGFMNQTTITNAPRPGDEDLFVVVDAFVRDVALWWPHGYGRQVLHNVTATVHSSNGALLDTTTISLGVRAIELITYGDPLKYDNETSSSAFGITLDDNEVKDRPVMFFRVNGVPIFAKGANLVPFDAFQSRVNDTFMEDILDSAIDANMNMIRVWGGGLFPLDSFYEMADRKGIMLWQEMIFACAQYPIDSFFLSEVRSEIQYQLRRLGKFSAISVWSGNNENGIYDKGPGSPYEVLDYDNVMYEVIRQDTSRPVWPSSPSTGYAYGVTHSGLPSGTMAHPLPFKAGGRSGDSHYYNYFSCPNVSLYPKTNFGSEYGFQSLPWFPSFERISEPEDWSLFSPFMNHRQHHPNGNPEIAALLHQNFQVPDLNSTSLDVFKRVIYLTQIQQTLCIADEGSYYRRGRNMPYRTMGSLYWQLNQNWEAPSWTSIDFGGVWKVLHYAMADVYRSLHLSAYYNMTTDLVIAHIASDELHSLRDVEIIIELIPFSVTAEAANSTAFVIDTVSIPSVPALSGVFYWNVSRSDIFGSYRSRCPLEGASCFLYMTAMKDGVPITSSQPFWLAAVKNFTLNNMTTFSINTTVHDSRSATVVIEASHVAPYTVIHTDKYYGKFSSNAMLLIPGRPVALTYEMRRLQWNNGFEHALTTSEALHESLYVECLNDMWS